MLPYFFRHYDRYVDRYIVYDDNSTDGTLAYLKQRSNVEVRQFERSHPDSFVLSAQSLHNQAWKESRGIADWVIWTAIDEHLYHPDFLGYLQRVHESGVTAVPALGFQMLADSRPQTDDLLVKHHRFGAPFWEMSKFSLFRPDEVEETNFEAGRHIAKPTGRVVVPDTDELLNLHYKYMGVFATHMRNQKLFSGLGVTDKFNRWGFQYSFPIAKLQSEFDAFKRRGIDVLDHTHNHHEAHHEMRWWRPQQQGQLR
jgi:hypothetical protein